jgi:hypothetical protein
VRSLLYRLARVLGDLQAIARGRVIPRLYNRIIGRLISSVSRRLWW